MAKILDIIFEEKIVGQLEQDAHGDMNFTYSSSWLEDPRAFKISHSLPLQKNPYRRKECRAFFNGILPEEQQRKLIARNLGISANNDFSMLEKIGGECAGAFSFVSSGEKLPLQNEDYHELTDSALANILRELPTRPLLAGEQGVRLSLAGVQDKLAVYVKDKKIFIPLNNSPSTHILKPDFNIYEGVIFNEEYCLKLAKNLGLSVAAAEIKKTEDIHYLLINRYDRRLLPDHIKRLHQEDFCQALSIPSTNKYQSEGGPSLKQCFDLIRVVSSVPAIDLERMIDALIFNFLIGNCDAHGKNFSFLYHEKSQLAPLYDLVCTLYYKDLDQKMAMKIGGEYKITAITVENFDQLAQETGFAKPQLRQRIRELIDAILVSLPSTDASHPVQQGVAELIKIRCLNFKKQLR